ncbi:MAG: hypothetical protein ACYSTL_04015 [Planctomycetota bacterium]|jgi:hypothetical protein
MERVNRWKGDQGGPVDRLVDVQAVQERAIEEEREILAIDKEAEKGYARAIAILKRYKSDMENIVGAIKSGDVRRRMRRDIREIGRAIDLLEEAHRKDLSDDALQEKRIEEDVALREQLRRDTAKFENVTLEDIEPTVVAIG